MLDRRSFTHFLFGAMAAGTVPAYAQAWAPSRQVRMIVPVAPGGTTDLLGRLLGQRFTDTVGQPVVVENRAGGAMVVGTDLVAKSAPDGHTLGILLSTHTVNAVAVPNLPYDSVRDFTPIAHLANFPGVLTVHPNVPVRSVAEFIAYARANPGKLSYGMPGPGTSGHLTMELLKRRAGLDIVGVSYRGGGPALNDLVAGHIHVMINSPASSKPHAEAGRIRALATTGSRRSDAFPELPTLVEAGQRDVQTYEWYGLFAAAGTPEPIVRYWHAETARTLLVPEVRARLTALGAEVGGGTPEEFAAFLGRERGFWAPLIREIGVRIE
jgi:tripartite-type tricarboxylate transporter receptor subunit TctC